SSEQPTKRNTNRANHQFRKELTNHLLLVLEDLILVFTLLLNTTQVGQRRSQIKINEEDLRCVLVLLVLSNKILHVGLGFGELHLVHTLLGVPVQEGLALEHGSELVADTFEE